MLTSPPAEAVRQSMKDDPRVHERATALVELLSKKDHSEPT